MDKAEKKYEDLEELAEIFSQDITFASELSNGAYNLILYYCRLKNWVDTLHKVIDIYALMAKFDYPEAICLVGAKATGAILDYSRNQPGLILVRTSPARTALVNILTIYVRTFQESSLWQEFLPRLKQVLEDEQAHEN